MTPGHSLEKKKRKLKALTAVTLLALTLLSCDITWTAVTPSVTAPPASTEEPATPGSFTATPYSQWLQIYFTDPLAAGAKNYEGGPDVPLVKAIDASRLSIEVAAYDLNLWSIRDALIQAEKRGVTVRMVMESDNMDEPEVGDLKTAGIPIVGDQREALMHDKYIIIDRTQVWTGSMNYTAGGTYRDNNNLICIQSAQAVENYTVDFNEMFTENRFGTDGTANTPYPELTIEGTPVQFYFSPDDGVAAHILDLINAATESVHFLAYAFTSDDIGQAIIARAQAGLEVRGVVDVSQSSQEGAEFETLKQRVFPNIVAARGGTAFDLVVKLSDGANPDFERIATLPIDTPDGTIVPVNTVARVVREESPNMVLRENVQRRMVVSCNVAGRDLGGGSLRVFKDITLPLLFPALLSAFVICFTISFDELVISSFIAGDQATFPVYLYSQLRLPERLPSVIAVAVVILVVSVIVVVASEVGRFVSERRLEAHVEPDVPLVLIDAVLVEQAIVNLLENAVRHGGSDGCVSISVRREGESAVVTVSDEGPGFPPQDAERVFDKFYRAAGGPGAGLGLAIARTIVTAHGGAIRAEPRQPRGARFAFTLPLSEAPPPPPSEEPA